MFSQTLMYVFQKLGFFLLKPLSDHVLEGAEPDISQRGCELTRV